MSESSAFDQDADKRDSIWDAIWRVLYEVRFQTSLAKSLLDSWTKIDDVTKVLVALFASGSAISGWALWEHPNGKVWWLIFAGITSVVATVHAALGVSGRVKDWGDIKRKLLALAMEIETFQEHMRIHHDFEIDTAATKLSEFRSKYAAAMELAQSDFLITRGLQLKLQDDLDSQFGVVDGAVSR